MKRLILLPCLFIFVALFATVTALMREHIRPQFNTSASQQVAPQVDALPQRHLNQNQLHKLIIRSEDAAAYAELAQRNAIRREFDYGSFKLVEVDEVAAGGRDALLAMPAIPNDESNMIWLNGYLMDTSAQQQLSKALPEDLKLSRMAEARSRGGVPDAGLYIVQFAGPIKGEWLDALVSTGADVITYVSNNAYVVRCNARSAALVSQMKDKESFV